MKIATCPWEEQLRKALAGGGPDPALRDHARRCPVCRDVLVVSSWMLKFRDLTLDTGPALRPVRDPQEIWERAPAGRTIDLGTANKALKPITVYRKIAWLVSAVGSAVLVLLEFEKIKGLLASLPGLEPLTAFLKKTAETGGGPLALAIAPAALGLATIILLILVTGMKRVDTRPKYSVHSK
jgi:hypothetical protein